MIVPALRGGATVMDYGIINDDEDDTDADNTMTLESSLRLVGHQVLI